MLKKGLLGSVLCMVGLGAAPTPVPVAPVGRVEMVFTERAPESKLEELIKRMDVDLRAYRTPENAEGAKAQWVYEISKQTFEVVVPAGYQKTDPHGLLVWIGGAGVSEKWLESLARRKLILVTAKDSDGRVAMVREGLALDAVQNLGKRYTIDPQRVYVAGFSHAANVAAWLVRGYPEIFHGGIFMMGGCFYKTYEGIDGWFFASFAREGTLYASALVQDPQWKAPLQQVKGSARLVLMRGKDDEMMAGALKDGKTQCEGLVLDGFVRASFIETPGGHVAPGAEWFEKALLALEGEPLVAPTTAPTHDANPGEDQVKQAKRMLTTAQHGAGDMKTLLAKIVADYPTTPAAVRAKEGLDWLEQQEKKAKK